MFYGYKVTKETAQSTFQMFHFVFHMFQNSVIKQKNFKEMYNIGIFSLILLQILSTKTFDYEETIYLSDDNVVRYQCKCTATLQ